MSDTIQSANELACAFWRECVDGSDFEGIDYDEEKATKLVEADRAAHIALGRELERTARAEDAKATQPMSDLITQWAEAQGFKGWLSDHGAVMRNFGRWCNLRQAQRADDAETIQALERAIRKLRAYIGVCSGDKELTQSIIPGLEAALSRLSAGKVEP